MKNIKLHAIILEITCHNSGADHCFRADRHSYPEVRYRSYRIVADAVRSAFGYFDNT